MKIAFLGDSITEGCGASSTEFFYVNQVGKILDAEVLNYGVGGTRISKQKEISEVAQWDYDFLSRAEIMEKDVDLVIVFGGTNDYGHGKALLGDVKDDTSYTFYGGINVLLEYLIKTYGKSKIGVVLPIRRFNDHIKNQSNGVDLKRYVDIEKEVCDKFGIKTLDLYSDCLPAPLVDTGDKYTTDGVHPNDLGHTLIAEKVSRFIKENW